MKKVMRPDGGQSGCCYRTVIGNILIADNGEALTRLSFLREKGPGAHTEETPLTREAASQVNQFLAGGRAAFDLPIAPEGTPFQLSVWEALRAIPYGETRTYAEIAAQIGNPRACRAVGMANNRNPLGIVIPCHRVVGGGGKLVGYAGGLDVKAFLLRLEQYGEAGGLYPCRALR